MNSIHPHTQAMWAKCRDFNTLDPHDRRWPSYLAGLQMQSFPISIGRG
jgi:hypothetical protein